MTYIEQARKLRPLVVKAAQSLDDKDASEAVALFDGMRYDGSLIKAGTRINWHGVLKQAAVDLWTQRRTALTPRLHCGVTSPTVRVSASFRRRSRRRRRLHSTSWAGGSGTSTAARLRRMSTRLISTRRDGSSLLNQRTRMRRKK